MEITRTSKLTGIRRTMDLDITLQQMLDYEKGMLIQNAFPNLTPAEREFFMTGITEEEWNKFVEVTEDDDEHEVQD
jgi:hypothetical protein